MTLQARLTTAFDRFGDRAALEVGDQVFIYDDLSAAARMVAGALADFDPPGPFIGLLAARSFEAYAGLAGILLAGKAYLPLNPKFPCDRLMRMLGDGGCSTIVLGPECAKTLEPILAAWPVEGPRLRVVYQPKARTHVAPLAMRFPQALFVETSSAVSPPPRIATPRDYAYALFTSGSTGRPKGIGVTQENVCAYLDFILSHYEYHPSDRASQFFDLTFDPSVHDIFTTWLSGACLCPVPEAYLMAPARFINGSRLSIWYSVPSVLTFMDKLNMLHEDFFPGLRYSFFSGEALSRSAAEKWQAAAPNSLVVNYYGPTEATVNITWYHWDRDHSPSLCRNGGVPLGHSFPAQTLLVVDEDGRELPAGVRGELIVSGTQVAPGYLNNPEKMKEVFRSREGRTWYFTGDLVERDATGRLHFCGRKDHQVQVRGYRVEIAEVEGVIRRAAATDLAIVVPWPHNPLTSSAEELVAVLSGPPIPSLADKVTAACLAALPSYMVPSRVLFLPEFPLNTNGKIDRNCIVEWVAIQLASGSA